MAPGAPWWELALAGFLSVIVGQFFFGSKKQEPSGPKSGPSVPRAASGEDAGQRRRDRIAK